jgi:ATP-dependent DNA helicase RecG
MFLAHYAEKAGSGILDMFKLCAQANLPPPEFRQSGGQFIQTLNRDWLTEDVINSLSLNERQQKGLQHLKAARQISSAEYQQLTGASRQTATRDLYDLVKKKMLVSLGRGRGAHYVAARQTPHK